MRTTIPDKLSTVVAIKASAAAKRSPLWQKIKQINIEGSHGNFDIRNGAIHYEYVVYGTNKKSHKRTSIAINFVVGYGGFLFEMPAISALPGARNV